MTFSCWLYLLQPYTSVGRRCTGKKNVTLFKKSNGRTVGPSVMVYLSCAIIGLGVGKVRSNMDWSSSIYSTLLHSAICCKWWKLATPLLLLLLINRHSMIHASLVSNPERWPVWTLLRAQQTNQVNWKKKTHTWRMGHITSAVVPPKSSQNL